MGSAASSPRSRQGLPRIDGLASDHSGSLLLAQLLTGTNDPPVRRENTVIDKVWGIHQNICTYLYTKVQDHISILLSGQASNQSWVNGEEGKDR